MSAILSVALRNSAWAVLSLLLACSTTDYRRAGLTRVEPLGGRPWGGLHARKICVSADEKRIVCWFMTRDREDSIAVLDDTLSLQRVVSDHDTCDLAVSPSGRWMVTCGGGTRHAILYDLETGSPVGDAGVVLDQVVSIGEERGWIGWGLHERGRLHLLAPDLSLRAYVDTGVDGPVSLAADPVSGAVIVIGCYRAAVYQPASGRVVDLEQLRDLEGPGLHVSAAEGVAAICGNRGQLVCVSLSDGSIPWRKNYQPECRVEASVGVSGRTIAVSLRGYDMAAGEGRTPDRLFLLDSSTGGQLHQTQTAFELPGPLDQISLLEGRGTVLLTRFDALLTWNFAHLLSADPTFRE